MLRILIETFELKLAALQAKSPPSRLQKKSDEPLEVILEKIQHLEEDLKSLSLWCQSCQKQIDKALKEIGATSQPPLKMTSQAKDKEKEANTQVTAIFKAQHK